MQNSVKFFFCLASLAYSELSVNVLISQIDADDEIVVLLHKHILVDYQQQKVYIA